MPGICTSRKTRSGRRLCDRRDRGRPVPGLAHLTDVGIAREPQAQALAGQRLVVDDERRERHAPPRPGRDVRLAIRKAHDARAAPPPGRFDVTRRAGRRRRAARAAPACCEADPVRGRRRSRSPARRPRPRSSSTSPPGAAAIPSRPASALPKRPWRIAFSTSGCSSERRHRRVQQAVRDRDLDAQPVAEADLLRSRGTGAGTRARARAAPPAPRRRSSTTRSRSPRRASVASAAALALADEHHDGVQRVEEEVRLQLHLHRGQPRLRELGRELRRPQLQRQRVARALLVPAVVPDGPAALRGSPST